MAFQAKVSKWGNSMAIRIPTEVLEERKIKEGDEISIEIFKIADLSDIFGTLKFKESAQKLKDMARKGWD